MEPIKIIEALSGLPSRLGKSEAEACELLCGLLKKAGIKYSLQEFSSQTPDFKEYSLTADGEKIDCLPTGLKSGEVTTGYNLISSLTSSQNFIDTPNINFNPKSNAICLCNFYFAPSFAVSRLDVPRIMKAKEIRGTLKVEPKNYKASNILVGNLKNPKAVLFAHYDAYFSGATDNASGVAVALSLILRRPELLNENLFIFAGNEELSFDYPIYWGRCFREFAREYSEILDRAEKIFVIDSVGDGAPLFETDAKLLKLSFPIGERLEILAKASVLTGDFESLMSVYHGPEDLPNRLNSEFLNDTVLSLAEQLIAN